MTILAEPGFYFCAAKSDASREKSARPITMWDQHWIYKLQSKSSVGIDIDARLMTSGFGFQGGRYGIAQWTC